jgi:hypothetical protein
VLLIYRECSLPHGDPALAYFLFWQGIVSLAHCFDWPGLILVEGFDFSHA